VKGTDHRMAIQQGIDKALSIQEVEGVLIIYEGMVGTGGRIPQLIKVAPSNLEVWRSTR
jgi:ApbE superfamily uncharacterized protein (UPF0280 family)